MAVLRQGPHEILGNIAELYHQKWKPEDHPETIFRYIEINSVSRDTGEVSFTEVPTKEAPNRAQMMVQKDDIIVSLTRPHHGSIALIDDDLDGCIVSTGFAVLREIKDTTLRRLYLCSVLQSQPCLNQMLQRSSGGSYPAITKDQLMQILIPVPKVEFERALVSQMQAARTAREEKLKGADVFLDSIDDYVLAELGIEMPAVEEKKFFVVFANEIIGRRVDPRFHQPKYRNFYSMLEASKYQVVMLKDLIRLIYRYPSCYGFSCYDSTSDTRVPFLQGEDIGATEISYEKLIFIEKEISEKYPKTILKEGDLIFSVRGTIGKIAVVTHAFENSNISPNLIRLSLKEGINPQYVEIVLKSKIGQNQIDRLTSGGVQPTITKQDILSIEIPLPSLDIQNGIAQEAMRRRLEEAKLRQEALKEWKTAKDQFEEQLLSGKVL